MQESLTNSGVIGQLFQMAMGKAIPESSLTVSGWADSYRFLGKPGGAQPYQKWHTGKVPFMKEVMDCATNPRVTTIVVMGSSQVGKTEAMNNIVGYFMAVDPCPIKIIQPSIKTAIGYSKGKLDALIEGTPSLAELVPSKKSKNSDNSTYAKKFPGGEITIGIATSASDVASTSNRLVLMDEIDRYPEMIAGEGDPVALAIKRATTFTDKKIVLISTPTLKNQSRIEAAYEKTDKRKYFVPCPACGEYQELIWEQLKWEKGKPETARYECSGCQFRIPHFEKEKMLSRGDWVAERPLSGSAGFFIFEIYSPWVSWADMATAFEEAKAEEEKKGDSTKLQVFYNTSLARTWDPEEELKKKDGEIRFQQEPYPAEVPDGVMVIVAGVDVQGNRLEVEVVGFGRDQESWSLGYHVLEGDPTEGQVWDDLKSLLNTPLTDTKKRHRPIDACAVDSGAYTKHVYGFVARNRGRRIYAVKGSNKRNREFISRPRTVALGEYETSLWVIGTEKAKHDLYKRLRQPNPGPGYCHFPARYTQEYFDMLLSEKEVLYKRNGVIQVDPDTRRPITYFVKIHDSARNEALDCRIYAEAALTILNPQWARIEARLEAMPPPEEPRPTPPRKTSGWMRGIREGQLYFWIASHRCGWPELPQRGRKKTPTTPRLTVTP